jgi:hypothetical protein
VNLRTLASEIDRTKTEKFDNYQLMQLLISEVESIEGLLSAFADISSDKALEAHLLRVHA